LQFRPFNQAVLRKLKVLDLDAQMGRVAWSNVVAALPANPANLSAADLLE
jgi:hypothetical protein